MTADRLFSNGRWRPHNHGMEMAAYERAREGS